MNRPASIVPFAACAALLLAGSRSGSVAEAAPGEIALSWDLCSPIVQDITATTGTPRLFISVLGNDDTHSAYVVSVLIGAADRTTPDAWRFDGDGCQPASMFSAEHLPDAPTAKNCPAFQGGAATTDLVEYFGLIPAGMPYATSQVRAVLANAYAAGTTSQASQRSFLAEFRFDHVQSVAGEGVPGVTCGGLETPLCFKLLTGLEGVGTEILTSKYWSETLQAEAFFVPSAFTWVTVNGLTGCPTVPAVPSTWGQIKSVYRR